MPPKNVVEPIVQPRFFGKTKVLFISRIRYYGITQKTIEPQKQI